jgi:hypothetical protein
MQQMYFSNQLYQQRLEALFLIPSDIKSLKNPTNIALRKTINEINEA